MSSEVDTKKEKKSQEESYHDFCCKLDDPSHKIEPSDFVHLHNHTHYSLLDGLTKVPDLIGYVKEQGMQAVAVTDHGTMSSLIELYKEAKAADIKPILGLEAYVAS